MEAIRNLLVLAADNLQSITLNHEEAEAVVSCIDELAALRADNAELNRLFDLQHTRMEAATKAWQEAHPEKPGTLPDLGDLLGWLLAERDRLREFADDVRKWSEAYPTNIFTEPTPEQVDAVCKTLGFRLDRIAAMVLREFTKPWGDAARAALEGK